MIIWSVILERDVKLHVFDENAAMIQVMTTGKNPTMRGLGTTHGVSINRLYELFQEEWNTLTKVDTKLMAGDIFTKGFEAKDKWMEACKLINVGPRRYTT